jgi:hypothetical protein
VQLALIDAVLVLEVSSRSEAVKRVQDICLVGWRARVKR